MSFTHTVREETLVDPSTIAGQVRRARSMDFITRIRTNATMSPLPASYLMWLLWDDVPAKSLLIWVAALMSMDLTSALHGTRFIRRFDDITDHKPWVIRQTCLQASAGFVWSMAAIWYNTSQTSLFDINLVLLGAYALSSVNLVYYRASVALYSVAMWTVPATMLVTIGGAHGKQLVLGVLVLALSIAIYLNDVSGQLTAGLSQRFHAKELANQLRISATEIERLASYDDLCGCLNRRRGMLALAHHTQIGGALSLMLVDADHFKRINDSYGHPAGDAVLRCLSHNMSTQIRDSDVLARVGGEEFLILLPDTDAQAAQMLAQRLSNHIGSQRVPYDEKEISVTVSIGVASLSPGESPESLFVRADEALYRAKDSGRNRVEASVG